MRIKFCIVSVVAIVLWLTVTGHGENAFISPSVTVRDADGQPIVLTPSEVRHEKKLQVNLRLMDNEHLIFDPAVDSDLECLIQALVKPIKTSKEPPKGATPREQSSLKQYRRGLQEINLIAKTILNESGTTNREEQMRLIREIAAAINNSRRPRVPDKIEGVTVPWVLLKQMHRPVGKGTTPAVNLEVGTQSDLSLRDPKPATFWRRPENISAENLYVGFGRKERFQIDQAVCKYVRAKDSYGMNPGFEVVCHGTEVKLKFAELSSEPFTTRIFDALGFHADPTDYDAEVKVYYDRRIFTQFNSRQDLQTRFTGMGIPLYTMSLQPKYDPFKFIKWAVLHDGQRWTGAELKARLISNSETVRSKISPSNFRTETETLIDYLVMVPANIQPKDERLKSVGPWDYDQLDHANRRELRGVGLLAAWLGFFDSRFDNTKLRILETEKGDRVIEYFSDLGGGMGETSGLLFQHGERPNQFPWTFTLPPLDQGPHRLALPLRIAGYNPIAPTASFAAMTIDDARWMARLIGQLTEQQILAALIGSGYDSATARLYLEKLISRRDRMIIDLGLRNEISLLRLGGIDRKFSYNPQLNRALTIKIYKNDPIMAVVNGNVVVNGRLLNSK